LQEAAARCRLCFNTVPAPVIHRGIVGAFPCDALVIDLASEPGGVDFGAAAQRNLRTMHALSIPASYAPESAGERLGDLIADRLDLQGREAEK
jgi:dipicolinate synthase subunit A